MQMPIEERIRRRQEERKEAEAKMMREIQMLYGPKPKPSEQLPTDPDSVCGWWAYAHPSYKDWKVAPSYAWAILQVVDTCRYQMVCSSTGIEADTHTLTPELLKQWGYIRITEKEAREGIRLLGYSDSWTDLQP